MGIESQPVSGSSGRQSCITFVNLAKYQQVISHSRLKTSLTLRFLLKSQELVRDLFLFEMVDSFLSTGTTRWSKALLYCSDNSV